MSCKYNFIEKVCPFNSLTVSLKGSKELHNKITISSYKQPEFFFGFALLCAKSDNHKFKPNKVQNKTGIVKELTKIQKKKKPKENYNENKTKLFPLFFTFMSQDTSVYCCETTIRVQLA